MLLAYPVHDVLPPLLANNFNRYACYACKRKQVLRRQRSLRGCRGYTSQDNAANALLID
jgi:hypothetical protein